MVPLFAQRMTNRSVRLSGAAPVVLRTWKYLEPLETIFDADLDSNARSGIESQFLSIMEPFVADSSRIRRSPLDVLNLMLPPKYAAERTIGHSRARIARISHFLTCILQPNTPPKLSELVVRLSPANFLPCAKIERLNTSMTNEYPKAAI